MTKGEESIKKEAKGIRILQKEAVIKKERITEALEYQSCSELTFLLLELQYSSRQNQVTGDLMIP